MGISQISKEMKENMTNNMESQKAFQKQLILKQRQMQLATQQALGRERFKYYLGFYVLTCLGCVVRLLVDRSALNIVPLVPLSFITAFQYDLYYGRMMYRVQQEAAKIIKEEPELLQIPEGTGIMSLRDYRRTVIYNKGAPTTS